MHMKKMLVALVSAASVVAMVKVSPTVQAQVVLRKFDQPKGKPNTINIKAVLTTVVPASVKPLVDQLADPDWPTREAAAARLQTLSIPDEALMRVLDEWSLVPEQRHRLLNILDRRITSRKRGAIGIKMSPSTLDGISGILVTDLIADLPARRVMRIGDIIRRIDDAAIRTNDDLIRHVQQLPPGRRIEVEVLRPLGPDEEDPARADQLVVSESGRRFQVVEVEFALGSYEKLGDTQMVSNPETTRRRLIVAQIRKRWSVPVEAVTPVVLPPVEKP